jgi:hypothetical protein
VRRFLKVRENRRNMSNRITLTLVFTLSFFTYMTQELSTSLQLAPIALFAALVFFKVIWSRSILAAVGSLFELDALLFIVFVSVLTIATSVASGSSQSLGTAVLIAICLVLARIYMTVVPLQEVLEAFFWSGIVSIGSFTILASTSLVESIQTLERFSPFSFHPNLLAFLLAGYFCAMVWKFIVGDWRMKILTGLFGSLCLAITFFASSRGSIVAIIAGSCFVAGMAAIRARRERRLSLIRLGGLAAALVLGIIFFAQSLESTDGAYEYVDQVLQLTQDQRGLDSGLTGRWDRWKVIVGVFSDGTFMVGRGIRSTDQTPIDNSYLVILYEIGLVPLILITWRYFSVSRRYFRDYFRSTNPEARGFYLACSLLLAVFLVNNIVARFLFSVGNPYSLVALLIFVTPARGLATDTSVSKAGQKLLTPTLGTRPQLLA